MELSPYESQNIILVFGFDVKVDRFVIFDADPWIMSASETYR
jgi:hypothetical protein